MPGQAYKVAPLTVQTKSASHREGREALCPVVPPYFAARPFPVRMPVASRPHPSVNAGPRPIFRREFVMASKGGWRVDFTWTSRRVASTRGFLWRHPAYLSRVRLF